MTIFHDEVVKDILKIQQINSTNTLSSEMGSQPVTTLMERGYNTGCRGGPLSLMGPGHCPAWPLGSYATGRPLYACSDSARVLPVGRFHNHPTRTTMYKNFN